MPKPLSALDQFRARLHAEWLPAFANDNRRKLDVAGFREESIKIGEFDAGNFLRALDGRLIEDRGGGRYQCAQSKANEQLFWEGSKGISPRPITLWLEPIITIATIARLHYDLGWPIDRLGMQTADYAFDVAAYSGGEVGDLVIACEVKKTRSEVDHLISDLWQHSREPAAGPHSTRPRHLNSYRKWLSIRKRKPAFLWVVGPSGYGRAFALGHTNESSSLEPIPIEKMGHRGER